MSYQLPPLVEEDDFERLVRDIMRRVYDDPAIERFGRKGQAQSGVDGFSPADSTITFQCKLKDTRHKSDHDIRSLLLKEIEEEFLKTHSWPKPLTRFVFASTFKNDTELQTKAAALSSDTLVVEYWGWDTITERIWEYAEELIPNYYPEVPVRRVHGFKQISHRLIDSARLTDPNELQRLALDYYRINDQSDVVFQVICNDLDVRNERVMDEVYRRLDTLGPSASLWLIGDGGSGKTTILHRLAVELAQRGENVFTLNLETHVDDADVERILSLIKFCSPAEQTTLCIDNPAADEAILERILREIPDYADNVHIIFAERAHRYYALQRTGVLTYLHGEDESEPVRVRNSRRQREDVYNKFFDLLGISGADLGPLLEIVRDERLVYVNATYSILLELKRQNRIHFDFDWDDYRKTTVDLSAFTEGYKYIALFYLFGVRTPFKTFSRVCGADDAQQKLFLEKFRGNVNEPIVVDEWRDESFRKTIQLRTKHEIVSDIFFREHPAINKEELLMEWCERTDFSDPQEAQALINIFGMKKNYLTESAYFDFEKLIEFLLNSYLKERVAISTKLSGSLHLAKFWLLILRGRIDEAVKVLESFIEAVPEDLHSQTELAKVYQRQGRLTDAERILLRILTFRPTDLNSRTELAKIYQRQRRFGEAESMLLALLQIDEVNIRGLTEIAKVYRAQHRLIDAERALQQVIVKRPADINARTELAKVYQHQNRFAEAETLLLAVLGRKPRDLNSRTELAKIYQRQGKLGEAVEQLEEYLKLDPKGLHPRTELAKIYQRQGKLAEAEEVLTGLLNLDPKNLQARTELAKIYQRQGKLAEAEEVLTGLLNLDPKNLQARTELAKIYQRQGKLAEAEKRLLESLDIDEKQLHPRTELAKIYQRQGKLEEAVEQLEEYLKLDPKGLHPRTELAKIYQRQGKLDDAVSKAEEALVIDPLNDFAMSELLGTWSRQGEKEKCKERFLKFINQPNYRFSRYSQAPVFRFFQCCRKFAMKEEAKLVFDRFKSQLDDRNVDLYESTLAD